MSQDPKSPPLPALPPIGSTRWVPRRKAEVVAAVRSGAISLGDACARYTLSVDEFLSWQRALDDKGMPGLQVTRRRRLDEEPKSPKNRVGP